MNSHTTWWPVALSRQLRQQPVACTLHGLPLVVFRDADGVAAVLPDRCPHRFAPLSAGRLRDGQLQCPYHGWRFDAAGPCRHVPALPGFVPSASQRLHTVAVREAHGLVWLRLEGEGGELQITLHLLQKE